MNVFQRGWDDKCWGQFFQDFSIEQAVFSIYAAKFSVVFLEFLARATSLYKSYSAGVPVVLQISVTNF